MSGSETEWTAPPEAFLKKNTCYYCFKPLSIIYLFIYLFRGRVWGGFSGKESLSNAEYPSSIPGSGWSAGEEIDYLLQYPRASLMAQMLKNPPAIQETCAHCLGWEDPLEKGRAIQSSILTRRIPWTEEPDGLQSMGSQRVRHKWMTFTFIVLSHCIPFIYF